MKKIIYVLIACISLFGFTSCVETVPSECIKSTKEVVHVYDFDDLDIIKYEYEGHQYQMHYRHNGNATVAGVVHDPNCKCFSKDSIN